MVANAKYLSAEFSMNELAWLEGASCAALGEQEAKIFFSDELQDIAAAKRVCAECPVMAQCLEGAIRRREPCGVWGAQLFLNGKVLTIKRRPGRPRKVQRPEDEIPTIAVPEHLLPLLRSA